jgi:type IX secretion system substrate protein
MKIKFLFVSIVIGTFLPHIVFCQHTFLSSLTGTQVNQTIFISFTIKGGNTCTGTGIERSGDGIYFSRIGEIPGVCGSASSDETYSFTDFNPVPNTINYYRVELGLLSGFYSEVIPVNYLDLGAYGFKVFPNPVMQQSVIYFSNDKKELFDFRIFNLRGKLIQQRFLKDAFVALTADEFSAGVYHYQLILKNEIKYSGKVVFL